MCDATELEERKKAGPIKIFRLQNTKAIISRLGYK